jgi:hypothetical protein
MKNLIPQEQTQRTEVKVNSDKFGGLIQISRQPMLNALNHLRN